MIAKKRGINLILEASELSYLLKAFAYMTLMLSLLIFTVPDMPNQSRLLWWCMCETLAFNGLCVAELIVFLDRLRRRLGL